MGLDMVLESLLIYDDEYYDFDDDYASEGIKSFFGGIGNKIKGAFTKALEAIKNLKNKIMNFLKKGSPKAIKERKVENTRNNKVVLVYIRETRAAANALSGAIKSSNKGALNTVNAKLEKLSDTADIINNSTKKGMISEKHAKELLSELTALEAEIKKVMGSLEATSAALANAGQSGNEEYIEVCRKILPHISNVIKFINRTVSIPAESEE